MDELGVIILKMPKKEKDKFQTACKMQDRTMGSKIRELIKKWMAR